MKIIFITEKYHSGPQYGLTNNIYNLIGSWECASYGEYEHYFIDSEPGCIWSSKEVDDILLGSTYDAAIISVYHHLPSPFAAQKIGHKSCLLWWDAVVSEGGVRNWSQWIHQLAFDWGKGEEWPNCFCVEVPQDTRLFYRDHNVVEDIDVSFVGSVDAPRSDRGRLIQRIRDSGFNVWAGGGRGPGLDNLPIEEYANMFRRSKICLNLSFGHGRPQRKGRSFEIAACGQFMMSNCCEMFGGKDGKWFENEVDYASFDDINVIDRIAYFLNNEQERNQIADRIYEKYVNNYAPKHFWKKVLNICGVDV
jgi:hypothetical protein